MSHENLKIGQQLVKIIVTNMTNKNDAFAANSIGECVYISPSLVERFDLQVGQEIWAKLVPNTPAHASRGVTWRAYLIEEGHVETPPPTSEFSVEKRVLKALDAKEMMSTSDIAEFSGLTTVAARNLMDKLHREKRVVRADVVVNADQVKASRSVWALDDSVFTPLQE